MTPQSPHHSNHSMSAASGLTSTLPDLALGATPASSVDLSRSELNALDAAFIAALLLPNAVLDSAVQQPGAKWGRVPLRALDLSFNDLQKWVLLLR